MAVPVSFFHRDKARVDLGGGTAGLTVLLLMPLVDDLALGDGPVAEAKMKGFVLTSELYFLLNLNLLPIFFSSIYNHNLLKSV